MTTTETPTTTAPPKRKKMVRRGPPGVRCPDCGKLAGAQDEGEVEDYSAEASGDTDQVEVTISSGTLYLSTACCGSQFKSYDLNNGYSKSVDHECPTVTERQERQEAYDLHMDDADATSKCVGECRADRADPTCEDGQVLKTELDRLVTYVDEDGGEWTVDSEGEPEPYERSQATYYDKRTKTQKPIKSYRFAKRYRGFTVTVEAKHELCGETVEVAFEEGDIEAGAGDFEPTN